ncbi:MAG: glycosyltransferase family 4 protein [Gammaproteobacteria bacterium]|nr:glycosyltransferase family 4 protein [Gammaproteobacteria bacterium]
MTGTTSRPRKVVHLTSVHPRYDTRIFVKMCRSLTELGFDTHLVVADGLGDEINNDVTVHDVGKPQGSRFSKMLRGPKSVYRTAKSLNADIYHFHDPELMPAGLLLKLTGAKVIYDVHEDLPRQIYRKHWIPKPLRFLISVIAKLAESITASLVDHVITVTPSIAKRFSNTLVTEIRNYPVLKEFNNSEASHVRDKITYIGGISEDRGIAQMIQAFSGTDLTFTLAGKFQPETLMDQSAQLPGWSNVDFIGWQDREQIAQLLAQSCLGLVLLQPTGDYEDAYPVKMFEYMASGVAVLASDFPLWANIIESTNAGVCVDPTDPDLIRETLNKLLSDPKSLERIGQNGRKAVMTKYNWDKESEKLASVYHYLLGNKT